MEKPNSDIGSTLILVSGPPGIGKSTLSAYLAKELPAVHLDKDAIDEPFSPNERGEKYNREVEPKVLEGLLGLATLNLRAGHKVILDVPWTHILINSPEWIERINEVVEGTQSVLKVIECVLPENILRERIKKRGLKRDLVKLTDEGWAAFVEMDKIGHKNPFPHFEMDLTEGDDSGFSKAEAYIRSI